MPTRRRAQLVEDPPFSSFDARRYRVAITLVTALRWLIVNSTPRA